MGILRFFGNAIIALWTLVAFIAKMEWRFVLRYIEMVNTYTGDGTLGMDGSAKETHWLIRYPIRAFLWLFVPFVILLVPAGLIAATTAVFVSIDQATYPSFPASDEFVNIDSTPQDGATPTVTEVGSSLLSASYHQMEVEMNSMFGWTPNDTLGMQFFDNRVNRQLGVRHASIELLNVLIANVTKFGSIDKEDKDLTDARQGGFTNDPSSSDFVSFPFIETRYWEGIDHIKVYQANVLANKDGAHVNITNANIAIILNAISSKVLEVPRGRLTARNLEVSWFELDDNVFFAQGAAIVARDALVVIKNSYSAKITERGAMENLNQAIDSLDGVLAFHPWWIMRGDGGSMFADHRSKLARYYSEAIKRIDDVADALKG